MEEKKEKRDQIDIILVLFMNCGGRDRGRGRRVDEMAWKKENKGDSDQWDVSACSEAHLALVLTP